SDGNGSHASTLKSPSYTKSVSWQHYQAIEQYNVTIRKFPAVLTAKVMDYTPKKNYLPDDVAAVSKAPTIDFSQNANAH
ncbi:hypothetical protein OU567_03985, partial [Escherichia coli]|nr:hypothetical protein [Escherichia coli]